MVFILEHMLWDLLWFGFTCFSFVFCLIYWNDWLMGSYRLEVYISMIHDLYIAGCADHPKSNQLLPPYYYPSIPLPSGNHTLWSVSELQFYIPQVSKITWFLAFSNWLISLSIIFLRVIHVITNGGISSLPMAE